MYQPTTFLQTLPAAISLACLLSVPTVKAADATHGAQVFEEECSDCHSVTRNKKGPNLAGVVGRQSASLPDYKKYSDAMKALGSTWTAAQLDAYIAAPKKVVPGGKMKYDGLEDSAARADLIEYLSNTTKP